MTTTPRILVVDDEPGMLRSVERVLESRYDVTTASNHTEALAVCTDRPRDERPDMAIVDVRLPGVDGFEIVHRLRECLPDLDVIFMTGVVHELDAQLIRAIREKAYYFIQKPFDREVLLTLVERCLEQRRLHDQNKRHTERLERDMAAALSFQRNLLAPESAAYGAVSLAARCVSCDALSGDFYDYVRTHDERVSTVVADVSGHGVTAAMLVGVVKSAFRDAREDSYRPAAVVRRIANAIRSFDDDRFVTVFCGSFALDGSRLEYVNAGHPAALLRRADGLGALPLTGPMISPAFPDTEWGLDVVDLSPGDQVLVYTDGLIERRGDDGRYGTDRMREVFEASPHRGAMLLDDLFGSVETFANGRPAEDDETALTASVG